MSIKLSVNLDKLALIRNSRNANLPDVAFFGKLALNYGANGLTMHPRPDLRHILPKDVYALSKFGGELNIEGNPLIGKNNQYPGYLEIVKQSSATQCTLVPDNTQQITSNQGWDLKTYFKELEPIIKELKDLKFRVSLFMDHDSNDFYIAKELGVDRIELYTEDLAKAYKTNNIDKIWNSYVVSANKIKELGLELNAGHDLNLENLKLAKKLPFLKEVSIGHALVVDALIYGWEKTILAYKNAIRLD